MCVVVLWWRFGGKAAHACTHVLYALVCVQVVDSMLVGEADARARNKMAADLVNAFSSLRNKHATLHGVK